MALSNSFWCLLLPSSASSITSLASSQRQALAPRSALHFPNKLCLLCLYDSKYPLPPAIFFLCTNTEIQIELHFKYFLKRYFSLLIADPLWPVIPADPSYPTMACTIWHSSFLVHKCLLSLWVLKREDWVLCKQFSCWASGTYCFFTVGVTSTSSVSSWLCPSGAVKTDTG